MKSFHMIATIFFALYTLITSSSVFAQEKISIAVHNYPPFYNAEAKGLMTEVYQAAFDKVGVDATIQTLPIKRGILYLFDNKVDAFSPGHILLSPKLKEKAEWENSFTVAMVMIYYKPNFKKELKYKTLSDLRGCKIASLVNSPYLELYKKHGLIVYSVETPQQMIKMIRSGHVDFFVNTLLSGLILIKKEFPNEWGNFDYFTWDKLPCSIAVNKENPGGKKWLGLFRKGLSQIKKDGTYIRLFEKYWGINNIPKVVLFSDLKSFGVDRVNANVFYKPSRNDWGQIDLSLNK